ncbi:Uncharacterised protein [Mycobacterium tuberculosis]|nr:Uncharacterised protein [Mycobacterium tuberculosis]
MGTVGMLPRTGRHSWQAREWLPFVGIERGTQTGLIADKGERARARRCALCSDAVPDRR